MVSRTCQRWLARSSSARRQEAQPCDGSSYVLPWQPQHRPSASSCALMVTHRAHGTAQPYQMRSVPRAGTGYQLTDDGIR